MTSKTNKRCKAKTEVYSRVVGFYRPVEQWNDGKQEEFKERKNYDINSERRDTKSDTGSERLAEPGIPAKQAEPESGTLRPGSQGVGSGTE